MSKHTHYFYTFGESFCRRVAEEFSNIRQAKCRSTQEDQLLGGGSDFCNFVTKQEVRYAASKPAQYQTPRVIESDEQLVVGKTFISSENLNRLFTFTVEMEMGDEEGRSAKKMKVELCAEPSKNELFATTLRELVANKELVINTGNIDETPPVYSPFHRSTSDLHMYHQEYCTQGIIRSVAIACEGSNEVEEELTMTCSGVLEMKNDGKVTRQLFAYMIHIGSQMTVKALKEGNVVDLMIVYGLAANYESKSGWLYKLTVNFSTSPTTVIENFGKFSLVDAVNIIIEKITSK